MSTDRGTVRASILAATAALALLAGSAPALAQEAESGRPPRRPLIIQEQGSFMPGGTVLERPGTFDPENPVPDSGQTFHGDHAYVFYQIPVNARTLPLVMWHGGGQFGKTWESTPDGREGFQNIFLRRGWSVYVLDQPRRGRAGRSTDSITIVPVASEQDLFNVFRLGVWPDFFPGVQFPRDSNSLAQYFRQQTPNTGPSGEAERGLITDAVSALFDRTGPAVLITHSASGILGWLTAMKNDNVRAIITYEPTAFVFPEGEVPESPPLFDGTPLPGGTVPISAADFEKFTRIPIQVIFGDNIPTSPSPIGGPDRWRARLILAQQFVDAVNDHGGDASLLHLPDVGLHGNTHFPFSDLNNRQVARLLVDYLHEKGLDRRGGHGQKDVASIEWEEER
jgi:hypothetical protein